MMTAKEKYPTARYVKFERVVREKMEGGYYHIPDAIRSPWDAYDTIMELTDAARETQEIFGVLSLNNRYKVLGCEIVHKGSVNASIVTPRDVFKLALLKGASAIMVFHNHPSGECEPSKEDIEVTKRLKQCGDLMGIQLLDHLVCGDEGRFTSLKEKGYC